MVDVYDGNTSFAGGQNDVRTPDLIQLNQFRRGINLNTTDGILRPRNGFHERNWKVVTEGKKDERTYEQIFHTGKFQCARRYESLDGEYIIMVISGVIFRADPVYKIVEALPFEKEDDFVNQYVRRINSSEGGRFLVIYDYPNYPLVIDGGSVKRSSDYEFGIPPSVLGCYNQNRLAVSNAFNQYLLGDAVGTVGSPDAPVTFEEIFTATPFLGQSFSLGSSNINKKITGMGLLQVVNNTLSGLGPMVIGTADDVYTARTDLPRIQWGVNSFATLTVKKSGFSGPRSFDNANSDIFFHSPDRKIRTIFQAQTQQSKWINTPLSREVKNFLKEGEKELLDCTAVAVYDNKVFCTVRPFRLFAKDTFGNDVIDVAFSGLVVLDLANVSSLSVESPPAWDGLWTGIYPVEMIEAAGSFFIISKDPGGVNRIYEMVEDTHDEFQGKKKQIVSRLYTRMYDCQIPWIDKKEASVNYNIQEISGDFEMTVERRASHAPNFSLWKKFKHKAKVSVCSVEEAQTLCGTACGEIPNLMPHSFRELSLGDPDEVQCDPITEDSYSVWRRQELRITLSGETWELHEIKVRAERWDAPDQQTFTDCNNIKEKLVERKCPETSDWDLYTLPVSGGS